MHQHQVPYENTTPWAIKASIYCNLLRQQILWWKSTCSSSFLCSSFLSATVKEPLLLLVCMSWTITGQP